MTIYSAFHAALEVTSSTNAHDEGQEGKDTKSAVQDTVTNINQPSGVPNAEPRRAVCQTTGPDSTPREVHLSQTFEQAHSSIKRLDEYAKALKLRKPLPAGQRNIQTTDAHSIIRAGGALIEMLEIRNQMDSPRWWWSRGRNFYKEIKNHCKRARELENNMKTEDIRDVRREFAERGTTRVAIMPLTADQAEQISAKFRELLDEAESAAALFEQYRIATKRPEKDRGKALTEDLSKIERQVNAAVNVIDAATVSRKLHATI